MDFSQKLLNKTRKMLKIIWRIIQMLKNETLFGEHMFSGIQVIPDTGMGGKVLCKRGEG